MLHANLRVAIGRARVIQKAREIALGARVDDVRRRDGKQVEVLFANLLHFDESALGLLLWRGDAAGAATAGTVRDCNWVKKSQRK